MFLRRIPIKSIFRPFASISQNDLQAMAKQLSTNPNAIKLMTALRDNPALLTGKKVNFIIKKELRDLTLLIKEKGFFDPSKGAKPSGKK